MTPERLAEILAESFLDSVADADLPALLDEVRGAATEAAATFDSAENPVEVAERVEALAALAAAITERAGRVEDARARVSSALSAIPDNPAPPADVTEPPAEPTAPTPPVTASATPPAAPRLRPADPPAPQPGRRSASLVASGAFDGASTGSPLDRGALGREMGLAHAALHPTNGEARAIVASLQRDPRPVVLGRDGNQNLVDLTEVGKDYAAGRISLTAAAGPYCAPAEVIYDQFDLPSGGLWQLPTVDAPRGQTSYPRSPSLADITGDWADAIGSQTDPKTVYDVPCGEDTVFSVVSYPVQLRFDNFTGRFYPERVEDITAKSLRAAEFVVQAGKLATVEADPRTGTTSAQDSGGGFLIALTRALRFAVAYERDRHRLAPDQPFEVILPAWVPNAIATDIITRDATLDFAVVEARVRDILSADNLRPQFIHGWQDLPDNGWENVNGGAGLRALIYAPGAVVGLDGGELRLGVVRDSTRNADNTFDTFVETWEGVAIPGYPVRRVVNIPVCTSGGTGDRELITCGAGS